MQKKQSRTKRGLVWEGSSSILGGWSWSWSRQNRKNGSHIFW
ncbi:hypothetical protein GQ55_1G394100 [Panicum hallii var. hallii]|uniref:Uncharacterized protein n=1 Tax=Panicum hallii var. hallii TaxID=1504633 RepID=A0A2T7FC83_9POAL|nr:hypothetical protein GQ55_1G394100 [Panicum hallii var. hallii]